MPSGTTPGGGVTTRRPPPRCSLKRPDGHSRTLWSDAVPANLSARNCSKSVKRARSRFVTSASKWWVGRTLGAKRLDPVREAGVAAVELRPGVDDVEGGLGPSQRAVQLGEPVVVHAGDIAGERACRDRGPAFEEMEGALEVAVAGDGPLLVLEEQLLHAREVHARLHLIGLLRPMRHVDVAASRPWSRRQCPCRCDRGECAARRWRTAPSCSPTSARSAECCTVPPLNFAVPW